MNCCSLSSKMGMLSLLALSAQGGPSCGCSRAIHMFVGTEISVQRWKLFLQWQGAQDLEVRNVLSLLMRNSFCLSLQGDQHYQLFWERICARAVQKEQSMTEKYMQYSAFQSLLFEWKYVGFDPRWQLFSKADRMDIAILPVNSTLFTKSRKHLNVSRL